ncbi:MAG: SufE family protein [Candidatus Poseidoniaceae archaeon]|jgi:cysteine desulfuration protein SufE|nr:SufE family protein [Candidatus Poseidoniaceae archaeon]
MTWPESVQEIIDHFQEIDDKFQRLEVLMDYSSEVNELPVGEWNESNRVKGCQSIAHIEIEIVEEKVSVKAAADAKIVQGLQGILTLAINGLLPEQVLNLSPDFVEEAGILNSLTPSRSNGYRTMFDMIVNSIEEAI